MWTPSLVSSPGVAPESSTATHDVAGVAKSPATTVPLLLGPPAKGTSKPKLMPAPPKGPPPAAMMKQASSAQEMSKPAIIEVCDDRDEMGATTEAAIEKQASGRESSEMHPVEKEASGDDRRDDRDQGAPPPPPAARTPMSFVPVGPPLPVQPPSEAVRRMATAQQVAHDAMLAAQAAQQAAEEAMRAAQSAQPRCEICRAIEEHDWATLEQDPVAWSAALRSSILMTDDHPYTFSHASVIHPVIHPSSIHPSNHHEDKRSSTIMTSVQSYVHV